MKRNVKFILVFTAGVIFLTEAFFWWSSGGYESSLSLSVFSKVERPSQDYQFDGYHSVKAADEFSNTVQQWLKSPAVVNSIYQRAQVKASARSLRSVSKLLSAQKMAPQYVEVRFGVEKESDADKIAVATASVIGEKAKMASDLSGVTFSVIVGQPIVVKNQANFVLNGLIAIIVGFLLAIFIVLFKENDSGN